MTSLSGVQRVGYLAAALVYVGIQSWCTVKNTSKWPFCAYNMFNFRVLDRAEQLRVKLFDGEQWDVMTDVRGLLPLDFFRVVSILHSVYYVGEDEAAKQRFGQLILNEINNHPWEAVDEVRNALRPASGKSARGFELYAVEIDYRTWNPQHRGQVVNSRLLYTFLRPLNEHSA